MTPGREGDGISTPPSPDQHRSQDDPGPQLDELVRRLRAWSSASWSHGDRLPATHRHLQQLADDAAAAAGRDTSRVPVLSTSAIPDQLLVLVQQAMQDGVDPAPTLARIARALGFSR